MLFVIFKEFSVAKNCLKPESVPLVLLYLILPYLLLHYFNVAPCDVALFDVALF